MNQKIATQSLFFLVSISRGVELSAFKIKEMSWFSNCIAIQINIQKINCQTQILSWFMLYIRDGETHDCLSPLIRLLMESLRKWQVLRQT